MAKHAKLLERILGGLADANIPFDGLCSMLQHYGFTMRLKASSHHIFSRADVPDIINLQPGSGGNAKSYQVKQVRNIFKRYPVR